jgi:hypothetical protein
MDRRERMEIMGQWGGKRPDDDPRELARARRLAEDLDGSPLVGRPVRTRMRNFRPAVESYLASLGGPLPYMRRLRQIEEETAEHERQLECAWRDLADECGHDERAFAERWAAVSARWTFLAVNTLIDKHNRYYPAESRLPMDPRTGDFALVNGRPYRLEPLGAGWVLGHFPPALERAAA